MDKFQVDISTRPPCHLLHTPISIMKLGARVILYHQQFCKRPNSYLRVFSDLLCNVRVRLNFHI